MNHSGLDRYIGSTVMTLVILCFLSASNAYTKTIYVNSTATGANDGTSWSDAYINLQTAIDAAAPGDEVWVAAGIYRPTSWPNGGSEEREKHFSLKNGVTIYGGFSDTETSLDERNIGINETILSGDIGIEGDDFDNCYHVFYHPRGKDLDGDAVLDGFTITGGNANISDHHSGSGMYNSLSSPTLVNCTFSGNSSSYKGYVPTHPLEGGPVINYLGQGGGMYNSLSSPKLINCAFSGNFTDSGGGGMYNYESSPTLTNCTFSGNSAYNIDSVYGGGGMYNYKSSPTLTNCILWDNDADDSGNEVYNFLETTPLLAYCNIKGSFNDGVWDESLGTDGGNNIDVDPLFVRNPGTNGDDDPGDLHLTSDSPCVDAGDPSITDGQDMDGEARVFDGNQDGTAIVDIGADEYVDSDYDGIPDREDPIIEPTDTDNGGTGGSNGGSGTGGASGEDGGTGGSSGGCFINSLFDAGE